MRLDPGQWTSALNTPPLRARPFRCAPHAVPRLGGDIRRPTKVVLLRNVLRGYQCLRNAGQVSLDAGNKDVGVEVQAQGMVGWRGLPEFERSSAGGGVWAEACHQIVRDLSSFAV